MIRAGLIYLGCVIVGLVIGGLIVFARFNTSGAGQAGEADGKTYPFLAKRIWVEDPNDLLIGFNPLRKKLREQVKDWGTTFGFYFEYLPTGVSIGINEKEEYSPRSLIKVPIVMALYRYRERQGLSLDSAVTITKAELNDQFGELWRYGEGAQITLEDAAFLALTQSDNTAANILSDHIPLIDYEEVYEGLDIDFPKDKKELTLSAKQYASILKALYFSSVLSRENSQKILDLLTQTPFNESLTAPIPKDIRVAHKIGVLSNELFQDCGIIYYPKRQYLLCMISQSSQKEAHARMAAVSKTVYEYISLANGK